jgi:cytoskeleton-associated protein 5
LTLSQAKKPAAGEATASTPVSAAPKKVVPAAAASKGKAPPPPGPGQLDTFKFKHSPEDADALAADLIPSSIQTGFADSNWKARLAALEEMVTWVEGCVDSLDSEVVVRFLAKKGWSEKNFQVSAPWPRALSRSLTLRRSPPSFMRYWTY